MSASVLDLNDFDLVDKLNPDAKVFVPTSFNNFSIVKRIKNNLTFISMLNKVFKKLTIPIPKLLPPCPKLISKNRVVKTLEGLPCKKKNNYSLKNGIYTWGFKLDMNDSIISKLIKKTEEIFMSENKDEILLKLKSFYDIFLKNLNVKLLDFETILYSFCLLKKYGFFEVWEKNEMLILKNTFILGIFEII